MTNTAKFETGKTYFANGAVAAITITVVKRTAKMIQVTTNDSIFVTNVRYKINESNHGEFIKLGFYADAPTLFAANEYDDTAKAIDVQNKKAHAEFVKKVQEAFDAARREDIKNTPLVTAETQDDAAQLNNEKPVNNSKEAITMTIETKTAKNGSLILKKNGKRERYDDVTNAMYRSRNSSFHIVTDRGQSYTGSYNVDRYIFENDADGSILQFDSAAEAVNRLTGGHFRKENFVTKCADQAEINAKLQAEIDALTAQRKAYDDESMNILSIMVSFRNIICSCKDELKHHPEHESSSSYIKEDGKSFYQRQIELLPEHVELFKERRNYLAEQRDKITEKIKQLQSQIILTDF